MKFLLVVAAAVALSCPGISFAQAYPAKPVRYIVPFPAGASPDIVGRLMADLIGGQVPAAISNIPALLPPIQSGRARALAVTSLKRASQLPSVPTMDESGLKGYEVTSWYGACAPAGTPAPVLSKLHADLSKVLLAPDVQQRMTEMVIDAAPTSREDFATFIRMETQRWAQVVKDAGLALQ